MHSTLVKAFAISVLAVGAATMAHAQQSAPAGRSVNVGESEYGGHCAVCHGLSGKSDGPLAGMYAKDTVLPDLTELSKKNNGVFPFARVYETIDGTVLVRGHGPKDMPIWGREYKIEMDYVSEEIVRAKILALTEYVYRLQAK